MQSCILFLCRIPRSGNSFTFPFEFILADLPYKTVKYIMGDLRKGEKGNQDTEKVFADAPALPRIRNIEVARFVLIPKPFFNLNLVS